MFIAIFLCAFGFYLGVIKVVGRSFMRYFPVYAELIDKLIDEED